jgi:hypothetical protein
LHVFFGVSLQVWPQLMEVQTVFISTFLPV